jgi:DNA-binding MarR family transcriptional regulator
VPTLPPLLSLFIATQHVSALNEQELEREGIEHYGILLLSTIGVLGPVTPSRLVQESGLPGTTVRDVVGDLVARDLVQRDPNPEDARSHFLSLSDHGREHWRKAGRAFQRAERELEQHLGTPLSELSEPLDRLAHAARAARAALTLSDG